MRVDERVLKVKALSDVVKISGRAFATAKFGKVSVQGDA